MAFNFMKRRVQPLMARDTLGYEYTGDDDTSRMPGDEVCRMDLPGSTTSVGTRTDYSVDPWDYPACTTRHLKAWSTRTT
jgi:hypothetical protein